MKIKELFEENVLLESYKDAERIFATTYKLALGDRMGDHNAVQVSKMDLQRFKDYASRGLIGPKEKDISKWIGLANSSKTHHEAYSWLLKFRGVLSDAEDKIPSFELIVDRSNIKITIIENFAAAKKLCSNMRVCVRSNAQDFETYSSTGALFLVELNGKKYIYEYDKRTEGGTFWDSSNEEHDPIDILTRYGIKDLPRVVHHNRVVEDAIEFLDMELRSSEWM